jgi:hypothetical protein
MEPWDRSAVLRRLQTLGVDALDTEAEPSATVADLVLAGLQFASRLGVGMPRRLVFCRVGNEPPDIARYVPSSDSLLVNLDEGYWDDPGAEMTLYFRQRLFPSANPVFPVLHELGHRAHYLALSDSARWTAYRAMQLSNEERRIVRSEVGRNAARNPLELIADVLAARLEGHFFSAAVMALYRRFGGPNL